MLNLPGISGFNIGFRSAYGICTVSSPSEQCATLHGWKVERNSVGRDLPDVKVFSRGLERLEHL